MRYKVKPTLKRNRNPTYLEICHWVFQLNDPLMLVRIDWDGRSTLGEYNIIACGSNETILLLKYGYMLEQVL